MIRSLMILWAALVLGGCTEKPQTPGALQLAERPAADGRWAVINYWATWCVPCRKEIPELNALAEDQHERIAVYGFNFDGVQGEELASQAKELGIDFVHLTRDPADTLGSAQPTVLPTTLLVDPQGNVVATLLGPQTADGLLAAIEDRL